MPNNLSGCSPSVQEEPASTLALSWRARLSARSAGLSGKRSPPRSWLAAWRRANWMRHLFGRIYEPSTASRGVAAWISSLRDTPASPSAPPGVAVGRAIRDTYGPTSPASWASADRLLSFSRTCGDTSLLGFVRSASHWKAWVTRWQRDCSRRMKSGRATAANASSSWGTPSASEPGGTAEQGLERKRAAIAGGAQMGLCVSVLSHQVQQWPTPDAAAADRRPAADPAATVRPSGAKKQRTINDAARLAGCSTPRASDGEKGGMRKADGTPSILAQARSASWMTPTSRDHKDGACGEADVPTNGLLGRQVCRSSLPDPATETSGSGSPNSPPGCRPRLNLVFVLWLMGWPPTVLGICGSSEMASFPSVRQWRSFISHLLSTSGDS